MNCLKNKGLPGGVTIAGKVQPAKLSGYGENVNNQNGSYFQIVDVDALRDGELTLNVSTRP